MQQVAVLPALVPPPPEARPLALATPAATAPYALQRYDVPAPWNALLHDDNSTLHHAVTTGNLGQLVLCALVRLTDSPPQLGPVERLVFACDPYAVPAFTAFATHYDDTTGSTWRLNHLRQQLLPELYAKRLRGAVPWPTGNGTSDPLRSLPQYLYRMLVVAAGGQAPSPAKVADILALAPSTDAVTAWMTLGGWTAPLLATVPADCTSPTPDELGEVYFDRAPPAPSYEPSPPPDTASEAQRRSTHRDLLVHRAAHYHHGGDGWGWEPRTTDMTHPMPQQEAAACRRTPPGVDDSTIVAHAVRCSNLRQVVLCALTRLGAWVVGPLERALLSHDPFAVAHLAAKHYQVAPPDDSALHRFNLRELYRRHPRAPDDSQFIDALLELSSWLADQLPGNDVEGSLTALAEAGPSPQEAHRLLWAASHPLCPLPGLRVPLSSGLGSALTVHARASLPARPITGNFNTEWVLCQLTAGIVTTAGTELYNRHPTIVRCATAALFYGLLVHGHADARAAARAISAAAVTASQPPAGTTALIYHHLDANQGLDLLLVRSWVFHELSQRCEWDVAGLQHEHQPGDALITTQLRRDRTPRAATGGLQPLSLRPEDNVEVRNWVQLYNQRPVLLHGCACVDDEGVTRERHRGQDLEGPSSLDPRLHETAQLEAWLANCATDYGLLGPDTMLPLLLRAVKIALPQALDNNPARHALLTTAHAAISETLARLVYHAAKATTAAAPGELPQQGDATRWWTLIDHHFGSWVCQETMKASVQWALSSTHRLVAPCTALSDGGGGPGRGGGGAGGGGDPSFAAADHRDGSVTTCSASVVTVHGAPQGDPGPPLLTNSSEKTGVLPAQLQVPRAAVAEAGPTLHPVCAAPPAPAPASVTPPTPAALAPTTDTQSATPPPPPTPTTPPTTSGPDAATAMPPAPPRCTPPPWLPDGGGQAWETPGHSRPASPNPTDAGLDFLDSPTFCEWLSQAGAGDWADVATDVLAVHSHVEPATSAACTPTMAVPMSNDGPRAHARARILTINLGQRGWGAIDKAVETAERHHCDVLVVSETRLSSTDLPPATAGPDANWHAIHQPHRQTSGGVAVLVRICAGSLFSGVVEATTVPRPPGVSAALAELTSSFLAAPLFVCGVYLPPPGKTSCTTDPNCTVARCGLHHVKLSTEFLGRVVRRHSAADRLIITGDLNADPTWQPHGGMPKQERHTRWESLCPVLGLDPPSPRPDATGGASTGDGPAGGMDGGSHPGPATHCMMLATERATATRPAGGKRRRGAGTTTTHGIISASCASDAHPATTDVLTDTRDQMSDHFPVLTILSLRGEPTTTLPEHPRPAPAPGPMAAALTAAGTLCPTLAPIFSTVGAAILGTPAPVKSLGLAKSHTVPPMAGHTVAPQSLRRAHSATPATGLGPRPTRTSAGAAVEARGAGGAIVAQPPQAQEVRGVAAPQPEATPAGATTTATPRTPRRRATRASSTAKEQDSPPDTLPGQVRKRDSSTAAIATVGAHPAGGTATPNPGRMYTKRLTVEGTAAPPGPGPLRLLLADASGTSQGRAVPGQPDAGASVEAQGAEAANPERRAVPCLPDGAASEPEGDEGWSHMVEWSGAVPAPRQPSLGASPPHTQHHEEEEEPQPAMHPAPATAGAGATAGYVTACPTAAPQAPSTSTTIKVFSANIGGGGVSGWHARVAPTISLARKHGAQIVIVQETHLAEGREAVLPPDLWPGAHVIRSSRPRRDPTKSWGGVAVIAELGGELGISQLVLEEQCTRCDCIWVRVQASAVQVPIFVCAAYLPSHGMPSVCSDETACADESCCRNHPDQGARYIAATVPPRARKGIVIVTGDFNADAMPLTHLQQASTTAQRRWLFLNSTLGIGALHCADQDDDDGAPCLVSLNLAHPSPAGTPFPTRTTLGGRATTLDHVLHTPHGTILATSLHVLPTHFGDHAPLVATFCVSKAPPTPAGPSGLAPAPPSPRARWSCTPITLTTCNRASIFAGIHINGDVVGHLRAEVDRWHSAAGYRLSGEQYRVGVYTAIGRAVGNLRKTQRKAAAAGEDDTVRQLTTAMTDAHAALRRYQAQHRDTLPPTPTPDVPGPAPGAGPPTTPLDALVLSYSKARATLKAYLQRKMRDAARARTDEYLTAVRGHDGRTIQRTLRAALPDGSAGSPHPLATIATTMDVTAPVSARDVVPPTAAAGLDKRAVAAMAAQLHADALAVHFQDLGSQDPILSSVFLQAQQHTVAGAMSQLARANDPDLHPTDQSPQAPPHSRATHMAEGDITGEEVYAVLCKAKTEPSTLGTAMVALVAVYGGTGEADAQRREHLAKQLNDEWRGGDPAKDATTVVVTPIHKGGPPGDTGNYRTIAVGGALPKLLMLILKARLEAHLVDSGGVHPLQAGFQRGRSTEEHLVLSMLLEGRGRRKGKVPVTAFLDVRKAFGSVNHTILLALLWDAGVRGSTWTYLRVMLSRLQMVVKVDGQLSQPFPAQRGVPEGNVLSPLLFLLYINLVLTAVDAVDHPDAGVTVGGRGRGSVRITVSIRAPSFADDIRLFASSLAGLQAMMDALCKVLIDLRLQANIGVAKTAVFSPPEIGGVRAQIWLPAQAVAGQHATAFVPASNAEVYRYLGVMTDNVGGTGDTPEPDTREDSGVDAAHPQYTTHLARMTAVSNRGLHTMATSGVCSLPPAVAGRAYSTLLLPTIAYGIAAWGSPCLPKVLYKNEKHAARMVARSRCLPLEVLFTVSGMGRLDDAYAAGVLRSLITVCRSPRGSALRLLAVAEWHAWSTAGADARRGMWINDVLLLLDELDTAAVWNTRSAPCAHGSVPVCRPDSVAAVRAPAMTVHGWRTSAARILFWSAPGQVELPLAEEQSVAALMYATRRHALDTARLWRLVVGLWRLPSLRGVAALSARLQPAPYAHVRRSRANQLRTLARGGLRSLLGWAAYAALTEGGTTHVCPLCAEADGLTVMHLVATCQGLSALRARVWAKASALAAQRVSTGVISPLCELLATTPTGGTQDADVCVWVSLTLGDDIGDGVGLEGLPPQPLWRDPCYSSLLGVTGELLVSLVEALQALVAAPTRSSPAQ